ncbi:MAG: hypothetical protein WC076_01430 [Terrimicrobiaceae bacterium]|nr:hypothetical protein [Terrimicrobiaceae bacterium]
MVDPQPSIFTIRLTGEGVRPHLVAASDLAGLIIAAEQTVAAIARRENPEAAESLIVGLSGIQDQSIGLAFTSNEESVISTAYQELVAALENRLFRSLPAQSLEGLRTLTQFARERKGHTQFWNGSQRGPLLDLPPEYAIEVPLPEYQRGETVLYGRIERVGGVRPRVRLRVSPKEVVYGDITEDQSRILGSNLYSETALRGQATWDAQDGTVVCFRVEEILHYQRGKATQAFQEPSDAAGGAFDQIEDVDLFATRIREGDAP